MIHELVWFFRARKLELSRAKTKVEEYLANEKTSFLPVTADDIRFAITRMKDYTQHNDFIILSTAKRLGLPLLTFDQELRRIARANSVDLLRR